MNEETKFESIYIETKLNQKELVSLLCKSMKDQTKRSYMTLGFSILLVIGTLGAYLYFNDNMYLILMIVSILFVALSVTMMLLMPTIVKKTNANLKNGISYQYTFYENKVMIKSILNGKEGTVEYSYKSLEKVRYKDNTLFLYPISTSVFCVKMDQMNDLEKERLLKLLTPYQVRKKKRESKQA